MNALVCEMCGSQDMVKEGGVFVCQHCGTKYSVEEARKMMFEGTVKIDRSSELENLYKAARNARETSDDESAVKHYEKISALDPDSWEALFYLVILKNNSIKNSEIKSAAISVTNCLSKVFDLINENVKDEAEKKEAVWEVIQQCNETAEWLTGVSHEFYRSLTKGEGLMALTGVIGAISSATSVLGELNEENDRCVAIANIMCWCGNYIESTFDMEDEDFCQMAVWSWKQMLDFQMDYQQVHKTQTLFDAESVRTFADKINSYSKCLDSADVEDGGVGVLTLEYDCKPSAAQQLWFSIDHGEKTTMFRNEQRVLFLERGAHSITILNPLCKKEYNFNLEGAKTLHIFGKGFGMDINE